MNKKAQTEDLFADLPVAIIIIIVAAIILGFSDIKVERKDIAGVSRTADLVSFLKTPVNEADFLREFSEDDWVEDMNRVDVIVLAPLHARNEGYSKWEEKLIGKPSWIFNEIGARYSLKITYPDGSEKIFGAVEKNIKEPHLLAKVSEAEVLLPSEKGIIKVRLKIFGDVNYG